VAPVGAQHDRSVNGAEPVEDWLAHDMRGPINKRLAVPLEELGISCNADRFVGEKSYENFVTVVRFVYREILPQYEAFLLQHPTLNEVKSHSFHSAEDGRWFLHIEDQVTAFLESKKSHVQSYIEKAMHGKDSSADFDYAVECIEKFLSIRRREIARVGAAARSRVASLVT
jgi:hypothetical protein